ncbi:MAG: hypothetical protein LBK97_02025, partial [Prevotellaceae bacterium]|nr:hypothetical protein [Prevotellaceae bacterium]
GKTDKLHCLTAQEKNFLNAMAYEYTGNENFKFVGPQVGTGMPDLHTINGIGKKFLGKYDRAVADKKIYRTILFFSFLYFPVYPLGCYRVKFTGTRYEKSWIIYAEENSYCLNV